MFWLTSEGDFKCLAWPASLFFWCQNRACVYMDDCECVLWVGIAVSVCNNLVWPHEIGEKRKQSIQNKTILSECFFKSVFFPSGPESRERPGVLRVQCQAPHTAPSACEQTRNPSHSPIFFFLSFIPLSIPPNLFSYPSFSSLTLFPPALSPREGDDSSQTDWG